MTSPSVNKNILQSPAFLKYILETSSYPNEHEQLKQLRETTEQKYQENMGYLLSIPAEEAQFISILHKILNAKKTLEIGVFSDYFLLATALALPLDDKITAIDMDREAYEIGLPFIQNAEVEHKIYFPVDRQTESFGYVLVDTNKEEYIKYYELVSKLVKKGRLIAYDNTSWHGSVAISEDVKEDIIRKNRKPLIEFNNLIANDSRLESAIISIGDGLTLCRRL
ncbi:hypothetical protein AAZV13_08G095100 [Glycine max]